MGIGQIGQASKNGSNRFQILRIVSCESGGMESIMKKNMLISVAVVFVALVLIVYGVTNRGDSKTMQLGKQESEKTETTKEEDENLEELKGVENASEEDENLEELKKVENASDEHDQDRVTEKDNTTTAEKKNVGGEADTDIDFPGIFDSDTSDESNSSTDDKKPVNPEKPNVPSEPEKPDVPSDSEKPDVPSTPEEGLWTDSV